MQHDIENMIVALRRAGLRPSERQWATWRETGEAAVPALVQLACDTQLLVGPEPAAFGPIHALRLLGEWQPLTTEVVGCLLRALPLPDPAPGAQAPFVWRQDLPQIAGAAGANGLAVADELLRYDPSAPDVRAAAAETVAYAVAADVSLREPGIALLRERLEVEADPYVMAYIIDSLGDLSAAPAYSAVMDAFKRGAVDKGIVSAADVRKRLLGGAPSPRLSCVHHTLVERYEQHGPYTEEQRRVMADQYLRSQYG